jgi:hypothetical protein
VLVFVFSKNEDGQLTMEGRVLTYTALNHARTTRLMATQRDAVTMLERLRAAGVVGGGGGGSGDTLQETASVTSLDEQEVTMALERMRRLRDAHAAPAEVRLAAQQRKRHDLRTQMAWRQARAAVLRVEREVAREHGLPRNYHAVYLIGDGKYSTVQRGHMPVPSSRTLAQLFAEVRLVVRVDEFWTSQRCPLCTWKTRQWADDYRVRSCRNEKCAFGTHGRSKDELAARNFGYLYDYHAAFDSHRLRDVAADSFGGGGSRAV